QDEHGVAAGVGDGSTVPCVRKAGLEVLGSGEERGQVERGAVLVGVAAVGLGGHAFQDRERDVVGASEVGKPVVGDAYAAFPTGHLVSGDRVRTGEVAELSG